MPLKWTKPLSYDNSLCAWQGQIQSGSVVVNISCFDGDSAKLAAGTAPDDATKRTIEDRVTANLASCTQNVGKIIEPAIAHWQAQWRADREQTLSPERFVEAMQLFEMNLFQGRESPQYMATYDVGNLFGGYRLQIMSNGEVLTDARLQPPLSNDKTERLLPNLLNTKAIIPIEPPAATPPTRLKRPKRLPELQWASEPVFDRKRKAWIGTVVASRLEVTVTADGSPAKKPPTWISERTRNVLPLLKQVMTLAIPQIAELYNDSWNEGRDLSDKSVGRKLSIDSIAIHDGDDWSIWLRDGDLFEGHWIRVDVDEDDAVSFELMG